MKVNLQTPIPLLLYLVFLDSLLFKSYNDTEATRKFHNPRGVSEEWPAESVSQQILTLIPDLGNASVGTFSGNAFSTISREAAAVGIDVKRPGIRDAFLRSGGLEATGNTV